MATNSFSIKTTEGNIITSDAGSSILESALNNNFVFDYSCENGRCGACITTLLKGEVKEIQPQLALSSEDRANNKILTCCCEPLSDILIDAEDLSALHGIEVLTLPARIANVEELSSEIVEVKLRLPPTAKFKFLEGQYIDVIGPDTVRRSYSVASTSSDSEITLLIKKVEQGVLSQYWFNHAKHNDLLRIEGPKGTFFLRDQTRNLIFLATGTGIAPIISMLKKLDTDDEFKQKQTISLFWGNRYPQNFVWQPAFKKLKVNVNFVLSRPNAKWNESIGYVQDIALSNLDNLEDTDIYACGSNDMIHSAKQVFLRPDLTKNTSIQTPLYKVIKEAGRD